MKYVLTKKFTFEAAHRLIRNYTGKCNNNHGHSYKLTLSLVSEELDDRDMVIDFNETKALKAWIDEKLDHSTILWKEDPFIGKLQEMEMKLFITEQSPTSEHIAKIVFEKAIELFQNSHIRVHSIEINETCTSGATLYNS